MMEAVRTSETSVDNHFTRQYIQEDNSEHHTRRRDNLKSHICVLYFITVGLLPCLLPFTPTIIRQIKSGRITLAWHVARMTEKGKVVKVLVGKPEGKRPLRRPRR
jgi:hypothetical protein